MARPKNPNKKDTTYIGLNVTVEEKDNITRLAEEQKITRAQYIRQTLDLANQMQVNYPAVSTEIVQINLLLDRSKENMDEQTYNKLKENISNLTKLLY